MRTSLKLMMLCVLLIAFASQSNAQQVKKIEGYGIPKFLPVFNGNYSVDTCNLYYVNGNFGFGTTKPAYRFDVNGIINNTITNSSFFLEIIF